MVEEKTRVLIGKIGVDDHDRGIIALSEALRDAGCEVIYLGLAQKVDGVIKTAMQEGADVIGLGFHCGGHMEIMQQFMSKLWEQGLDQVLVIVGGIIPYPDIPKLKAIGISEVFLPGTKLRDIVNYASRMRGSIGH